MSYSSEVLADSPLLYLRMDEPSGSTLADSSGNGRNATLTGAYARGTASLLAVGGNSSTDFQGGYGLVPQGSWMTVDELSVEAWVRADTFTSGAGVNLIIQHDQDYSPSDEYSWRLEVSGTAPKAVRFIVGSGLVDGQTNLVANTTYHVVVTCSTVDNEIKCYINGVLDWSNSWDGAPVPPGTAGIYVGGGVSVDPAWDGRLDEVAFYGTVLSAARVAAHYAAASPPPLTAAAVGGSDATAAAVVTRVANLIGSAESDGSAQGTVFSFAQASGSAESDAAAAFIPLPRSEIQLTIESPVPIEQAPSAITFLIAGGQADADVVIDIDGTVVLTTILDTNGSLGSTTVSLSEALGAAGGHTLTATQSVIYGGAIGSADFIVLLDPVTYPDPPPDDTGPLPTAGQRWVLQDPGGLGTYVFPINPRKMTSPHFEKTLAARRTTAPDGVFHVSQAAGMAKRWQFSGYAPTEDMCRTLQAYGDLNRRFWLIDHRNRAWQVMFIHVQLVPRLRHSYRGVSTDWGTNFTVDAVILDQQWSTP